MLIFFKKIYFISIILALTLLPVVSFTKDDIGEICKEDSDCTTDLCQENTDDGNKYCVCNTDQNCTDKYAGTSGITWQCFSGNSESKGLKFCQSSAGDKEYALAPKKTGANTAVSSLVPVSDEIKKLLDQPRLRINIPGLDFTDPDKLQTVEEEGGTFLLIPYLGEYIADVYKYAVAVTGIVAVFVIIIAGIQWMAPGNIITSWDKDQKQIINQAKKRIVGAITGLVIAVSSYAILYTINPELVNFRNLKILYVKEEPLWQEEMAAMTDGYYESAKESGVGGSTKILFKGSETPWSGNDYCVKHEPSTVRHNPTGFTIRYDFFGTIDCNKQSKKRPASQIRHIVLHDGRRVTPFQGYMSSIEKKYGKTIDHPSVYRQLADWRAQSFNKGYGGATHYTIDRDGTIFHTVDDLFGGVHAPGYNKSSIGIDLIFDRGDDKKIFWTDAQYKSIANLVYFLSKKYPNISTINDYTLQGHGDCQSNRIDPSNFDYEKLGSLIPGSDLNNKMHERSNLGSFSKPYSPICEYLWIKGRGIIKGPANSAFKAASELSTYACCITSEGKTIGDIKIKKVDNEETLKACAKKAEVESTDGIFYFPGKCTQ